MTSPFAIELFAAHDFHPPVDVITICAQEVFPVIFADITNDKENKPTAMDFPVDPKVNTSQDIGDNHLSVTISVEKGVLPKRFAKYYAAEVKDALIEALGDEVNIEVEIIAVTYTRIGRANGKSSKLVRVPMHENSRFSEALDRMALRILTEDGRFVHDTSTGAIRLLAELNASLEPADSELDDEQEPEPSDIVSLGAGEPVLADEFAPRPAVAR